VDFFAVVDDRPHVWAAASRFDHHLGLLIRRHVEHSAAEDALVFTAVQSHGDLLFREVTSSRLIPLRASFS
jgi:hypothetical protein